MRRTSFESLEQLDSAARSIAHREALLNEARAELARAGRIGDPGRFTGQRIGSYTLGVILGRGAMGEVYEATHKDTDAPAAVKLLNTAAMGNQELVSRFYRELDIASSLEVPNVVQVVEYADQSSPLPYLAMERLMGTTLSAQLRSHGQLTAVRAMDLLEGLAKGIDAAHAKGIVHRDLKPQNVFAHRESGQVTWKILDFGVSKLASQDGTLTQGKLVGTPSYMSPEQAAGAAIDHRTDLYSIAIILYRVLTGRPAFSGPSVPAIMQSLTTSMPPAPSEVADLHRDFDAFFAIAIAKRPEDRFDSGAQMLEAYCSALRGDLAPELRKRARQLTAALPWS